MADDADSSRGNEDGVMRLRHYEVLRRADGSPMELGRGGMGVTYKAVDTNLRNEVALKVIHPTQLGSEEIKTRFLREARSAATLHHRNVASVFHLGFSEDDGSYFYVMEFVDGETVEEVVKRDGRVGLGRALDVAGQVASALVAAEKKQLLHRDIKLSNIMLCQEADGHELVKLIDFGLAKNLSGAGADAAGAATLALMTEGFLGTPLFASPEQILEQEMDIRSDIYSLGISLWYMLEGKPPFVGGMAKVMNLHINEEPPFERLDGVPAPAVELLRTMLAKNPDDRPATARELRQIILACQRETGELPEGETGSVGGAGSEVSRLVQDASLSGGPVAGRYQVSTTVGSSVVATVCRAYDTQSRADVTLHLIPPTVFKRNRAARKELEALAEKAAGLDHANVVKVFPLVVDAATRGAGKVEASPERVAFISEWVHGFSLRVLIRARGMLELKDASPFLLQVAEAVDYCVACGLDEPETDLNRVRLHFPSSADTGHLVGVTRIEDWPPFRVKVLPFSLDGVLAPSGGRIGIFFKRGAASPVSRLAEMAYQLLGGDTDSDEYARGRYVPVDGLDPASNAVLEGALFRGKGGGFEDGRAFVRALDPTAVAPAQEGGAEEEEDLEATVRMPTSRAPERSPATGAPAAIPGAILAPDPGEESPDISKIGTTTIHDRLSRAAVVVRPKRKNRGAFYVVGGLGLAAVVAVAMLVSGAQEEGKPPLLGDAGEGEVNPAVAAITPAPELVSDADPPADPAPDAGTVAGSEPEPEPEPPALPTLAEAAAAESDGRWDDALVALHAIWNGSDDAGESAAAKERFGGLVDTLFDRGAIPIGAATEPALTAAKGDFPRAQKLLGDLRANPANGERYNLASASYWYGEAARSLVGGGDWQGAVGMLARVAEEAEADLRDGLGDEFRDIFLKIGSDPVWKSELDAEGMAVLEEAAEAGLAPAAAYVGNLYIGIELPTVGPDLPQALHYLRMASDAGDRHGHRSLGECYLSGIGVEQDAAKAVELFHLAAEQDEPHAMAFLGQCYEKGEGVKEVDLKEARRWYDRAYELGSMEAAAYLGFMLSSSAYPDDANLGIKLINEAANKENPLGLLLLGARFWYGIGETDKDQNRARQLIERALELDPLNSPAFLKENNIPLR
ncbi:hypothetical protein BH23VER1_BH23VER1_28000 [soil metagenome]